MIFFFSFNMPDIIVYVSEKTMYVLNCTAPSFIIAIFVYLMFFSDKRWVLVKYEFDITIVNFH